MARGDLADAFLQNLIAVAMSAGAISAKPLTSAGLSGSATSAATRSHSTRSADWARAAGGGAAASDARPAAQAYARTRERYCMSIAFRRSCPAAWRGDELKDAPPGVQVSRAAAVS